MHTRLHVIHFRQYSVPKYRKAFKLPLSLTHTHTDSTWTIITCCVIFLKILLCVGVVPALDETDVHVQNDTLDARFKFTQSRLEGDSNIHVVKIKCDISQKYVSNMSTSVYKKTRLATLHIYVSLYTYI